MKRLLIILLILCCLVTTVSAEAFTAPTVPEAGEKYMPPKTDSFLDGVWYILKTALVNLQPDMAASVRDCLAVFAVILLVSLVQVIPGASANVVKFAGAVGVGIILFQPTGRLVALGTATIQNISEYGKLLIPVLAAALAAQGGVQTAAAMYTVTTVFCSILTMLISRLMIPMLYIYLCLSVAGCALGHQTLKNLCGAVKQLATFSLKTILYVFTGFLSITGVVSGATDASALKAAKLTISGCVPVVGGILSDASEAVLVGTGMVKNAAGIYGLLAVLSVCIGPFLQIGIQYLLTKLTSGLCDIFGVKEVSVLVQDFSGAMGLLLAMTGATMIMLLISVVCYMRGVA